jgi:uncharacterized protein YggE
MEQNIMTVNGRGVVTAVPDTAVIRLGVETTGENLAAIQADNARISQAVLQALKQMGIRDIKTVEYSINKVFDNEDGRRIDKGYSVRNIFEIRMTNMGMVGSVIDTAVKQGANVVDFITFEVSDSDQYYLQALNLAVMNAYEKAHSIIDTLDISLNTVPKRITENSFAPIPIRTSVSRELAFSTPVEPGSKQIEANVTVEFLYR